MVVAQRESDLMFVRSLTAQPRTPTAVQQAVFGLKKKQTHSFETNAVA